MKTSRHRTVMSEINVTPLVDVMLVLLIIFMVTAPLLQQGIDVNLPKAKGKELPAEERVTIIIKQGNQFFLNETPVTRDALITRLAAISKQNPQVFLKADKDVPYGVVADIMGEIKEAGIEKLGMVTEPSMSLK
ncbi:MAG TPA: protein TolR [Dissulfurispiraceae bacterium]|nr:protein TolR [Dissulfurispiraceae bacterium]